MHTMQAAIVVIVLIALSFKAEAQQFKPNYDEAKVPKYALPDPLVMLDGTKVADAKTWTDKRRPEILKLYEDHVYGKTPGGRPKDMTFEVTSIDKNALGGKAVRKEVTIYFTGKKDGPKMDLLIYLPADAKGPVPVFLVPNFNGNHAVHADPAITLSQRWMRAGPGIVNNRATDQSRGSEAGRFAIDDILAKGYGLVTFYYGDLFPDHADGAPDSVHMLFYPGQKQREPTQWGAIGCWAWGCSRALDYLETDKDVDARRVIVMGHSRLGKTALWAGAQDERFAIVISNNSGEGGAAITRRRFGENIWRINTSFPHWFAVRFRDYNDKEDDLPVDAHMLVALVAPRPVYIASAEEDLWADPRGEFLAALHAHPVYGLLGKQGLPATDMPKPNQPLMGTIGYHIRTGKHDVTRYDWQRYLEFADRHSAARRKS